MKAFLVGAAVAVLTAAAPAAAQDMKDMPGMQTAPTSAKPPPQTTPANPDDMAGMDMSAMIGTLGSYPMTRDASGTSWQPDASVHEGLEETRGRWSYMVHGDVNGVYDWQQGPRGGEKTFVSGMLMGMARRDFANLDTLQLRAMLSPEPFIGKSGYPLLLASGETADGKTPLIDRQHPHNLFMELSATYTHRLSEHDNLFVYAGLPGEPAFGPPAFMHRMSIMDSPEAPISHHWLDSTHITFGVVTEGWVHDNWKVEVSQFKGREPDQYRFDIESPKFDSVSARVSWNPTDRWALQASWANQISPEQLLPNENERRWTTSAIYTAPFGEKGWWSTTAAWGQRQATGGPVLAAYVLESAVRPNDPWTVFARAESTRTDELTLGLLQGPVETVSKISVGAIHDWRVAPHLKFGLGALYAFNFVPSALAPSYGSDDPHGAMVFVRFKLI